MNLSDITTKAWILALFKRDDGERFLLGDGYYDFKDSLQHFQPNSMSNDIVELQGTDGQLLAGQVRRSGTQSFDGYIGDGTTNRKIVEQRRKAFLMFFRKKHYYTVVYIFCDGTAIKRERGYLVDAPSVPEIRQKSPEYHVALNFENVNYYEYAENAQGDEIYSNVREIVVSNLISGGLVWDALGAVSEALQWGAYTTESGSFITLNDAIPNAPMSLTKLSGNAEQNGTPTPDAPVPVDVVTGEQTVGVTGKNLFSGNFSQFNSQGGSGATYSYFKLPTDGRYTLSLKAKNNVSTQSIQVFLGFSLRGGDSTGGINWAWTNGSSASAGDIVSIINESNGTTLGYVSMYANNAQTLEWFIENFDIQLELANQASPYEPYHGQSSEINLGKNLTDLSTFSSGYVNSSGTISPAAVEAGEMYSPFIKVSPNTAYIFKIVETAGTYQSWFGVGEYASNSESSFVRRDTNTITTADSITFTTSATTNYVRVSARNLSGATKVQLEKGSTSTSWAEYFTPIELAKVGTYQDYIWNDNGTWKVHKDIGKLVLTGSIDENWSISSTGTDNYYYRFRYLTGFVYSGNNNNWLSDSVSRAQVSSSTTVQGCFIVQNGEIRIRYGTEMTVADWKTKLSSNPITFFYQLETPTDTAITQQSLIDELNQVWTLFGGVNNIMLVPSGGAQGEIEISYATELNPGGGLVWEDGGTGGLTTITIDAVDLTLPVWTITGPATNPTLSNITTGQTMSWLGTVPSGQTLIIDMNEQTATMAGANVYAFLSGNWVGLAPGTNRISYSVTGTDESSTLSWNNIVG